MSIFFGDTHTHTYTHTRLHSYIHKMSTEAAKVTALRDLWQLKKEGAITMQEYREEKNKVKAMRAVQPVQQPQIPGVGAAAAGAVGGNLGADTATGDRRSEGGLVMKNCKTWYGKPTECPPEGSPDGKVKKLPWYEPQIVADGLAVEKKFNPVSWQNMPVTGDGSVTKRCVVS